MDLGVWGARRCMVVTAATWVSGSVEVEVSLVLHGPRRLGSLEVYRSDGCRLGLGVSGLVRLATLNSL